MKKSILFILPLLLIFACGKEESTSTAATEVMPDAVTNPAINMVKDTFDCQLSGRRLKETSAFFPDIQRHFAMSTEVYTSTKPDFLTFNVFQVVNTENCNLIYNGKLPQKEGMKTPYRLQTDLYEPINQVICTQDPENAFCYSVKFGRYIIPLNPPIQNRLRNTYDPNLASDLTVWGGYLIGWTESLGAYAHDIRNVNQPKTIAKSTIYSTPEKSTYVFILDVKGGQQVVISETNNNEVKATSVFSQPMSLGRKLIREKTGGRYAILRTLDTKEFVIVDMQAKKELKLPRNVERNTLAVKNYLKSI